MAFKSLKAGTKETMSAVGMEPIWTKDGILIYEVGKDLYMLTNETNQFNYIGDKVETCRKCPEWCA